MTDVVVICSLISLTLVVATHIFVIARWSGKIDAQLGLILKQPADWAVDLNALGQSIRADFSAQLAGVKAAHDYTAAEVQRLRDARHTADGDLQLLKGRVNGYDRIVGRLDSFVDRGGLPLREGHDPRET